MTRAGWFWVLGSLLCACGGAPVQPTAPACDRAKGCGEPAPQAVAPAPSAPAPRQEQGLCGGFEKRALAANKLELLGGRLLMSALDGAEDSARPHNVMSAPEPAQRETRLFLKDGEHKLVVHAVEAFARPGNDLVATLRSERPEFAQLAPEETRSAAGLRVVTFVQPKLDPSREAVEVAAAFTVLPDDTLQMVRVLVDPTVVRSGADGCQALARKLLATLEPGPHKLDLAGGRRALEGYTLELPPSFTLVPQRGPDFTVYRVSSVRALEVPPSEMGIYLGRYAEFEPDPAAKKLPGSILGQRVTWHRTEEPDHISQQTLISGPNSLQIHIFLDAANTADADTLVRIAATLKRAP